jgi:hypothetical protein
MKKIFCLLFTMLILSGCGAETVALIGGASSGKLVHSSLHTTLSYGIKKQTGKTPLGHAFAFAETVNPEKKKEPCATFVQKTNSKMCKMLNKRINLTKTKIIIIKKQDKSFKNQSSLLQSKIDKKSKIKYLD